jgi:hypothetical protein
MTERSGGNLPRPTTQGALASPYPPVAYELELASWRDKIFNKTFTSNSLKWDAQALNHQPARKRRDLVVESHWRPAAFLCKPGSPPRFPLATALAFLHKTPYIHTPENRPQ